MRHDYATGRKGTLSMVAPSADGAPIALTGGITTNPTRRGEQERATLLYVPGGGFILPPSPQQIRMVQRLANACDTTPIIGRHRLSPEHPFPAPLHDIANQYITMLEGGLSPAKIFMAADTAGAAIVMGALQIIRDRQIPMPAGVLLFSAWCDLSLSGWSYITKSATVASPFRMETAAFCARLYLGETISSDPLASPIFADLSGFPPIAIHTSEFDLHFDDAVKLAENARQAGVRAHINYWESPRHHLERVKYKNCNKVLRTCPAVY